MTRIGHFEREEDAALARERVALHVLGPKARRNFPDRRLKPASIEEIYRGELEPMNFPDEARRLGPADVRTLRATCERVRKTTTTSRFRGVSWAANCGRWRAVITSHDEKIHLGLYDDEEDAALAYDAKAIQLHGRRAKVNFPREP